MTKTPLRQLTECDYKDCRFERENLVFDCKGRVRLARFNAEECDMVISNDVQVLMGGAEFRKCHIRSATTMPGSAQHSVLFQDCSFHGIFENWKFGGRGSNPLNNCDFRDADLHNCQFYDCDIREHQFHGWPTIVFVIVTPHVHKDRLRAVAWSNDMKSKLIIDSLLELSPPPPPFQSHAHPLAGVAVNGYRSAAEIGINREALKATVGQLGEAVIV